MRRSSAANGNQKPKEHKQFYVEFEFPEVPSGKMYQTWHGQSTSFGKASFDAFKEVRKRPGIRGRRIHRMKINVVEIQNSSANAA